MPKHMIEIRGAIPTASPGVTDTREGGFRSQLICNPIFDNGVLIAIEFEAAAYHFERLVSPERDNAVLIKITSKLIGEVEHAA